MTYGKFGILILLTLIAFCCPVYGHASEFNSSTTTDTEKATNAANAARRSLSLQTELPTDTPPIKRTLQKSEPKTLPSAPKEFFTLLLWLAIILILVVVVVTLTKNLRFQKRPPDLLEEDDEATLEATVARMEKAHMFAEDLAKDKSFTEAMHLLLLQSLMELRRRLGMSIAASLTSREILNRVDIAQQGRLAFGDIILRVEISYFGTHEPGEQDYLACLKSFEILTTVLREAEYSSQMRGA